MLTLNATIYRRDGADLLVVNGRRGDYLYGTEDMYLGKGKTMHDVFEGISNSLDKLDKATMRVVWVDNSKGEFQAHTLSGDEIEDAGFCWDKYNVDYEGWNNYTRLFNEWVCTGMDYEDSTMPMNYPDDIYIQRKGASHHNGEYGVWCGHKYILDLDKYEDLKGFNLGKWLEKYMQREGYYPSVWERNCYCGSLDLLSIDPKTYKLSTLISY